MLKYALDTAAAVHRLPDQGAVPAHCLRKKPPLWSPLPASSRRFFALGERLPRRARRERSSTRTMYSWISIAGFSVNVGFQVNQLTSVMLLVVTTLSSLSHVYSVGTCTATRDTPGFRLPGVLPFFILLLVMANNFLLMFVGWEGVGLCSYLLIGFWYEKKSRRTPASRPSWWTGWEISGSSSGYCSSSSPSAPLISPTCSRPVASA